MGNPLAAIHGQRNRETRGDRAAYASHRAEVTRLLIEAGRSMNDTLCILGAGNGNDVDLSLLVHGFAGLTLVDLDDEALRHAAAGLPADRVTLLPSVDVTGVLGSLYEIAAKSSDDEAAAEALLHNVATAEVSVAGGPFDVVASTCLLSQVLDNAMTALGRGHPRVREVMLTLRDAHLRVMFEQLKPGGRGVLVTDYVSSITRPDLPLIPDERFAASMRDAVTAKQFMTGTNPDAAVLHLMEAEAWSGRVEAIDRTDPWKWWIGSKHFAVAAVRFTRAN